MAKIFTIENLQYKNILKDINFSLEEKTFNILVGHNGSGKTTLVNCIRQVLEYQGNILITNQNIKNNSELHHKIGFFTNDEYVLEKNILDELISFLINLGYTEEIAKRRIYNLSKKIGTTNILYKNYDDLKKYEKTLVSFLFSVVHEPKILIIDNELNSLDNNYKNKVLSYITSLKKLTVLFITTCCDYFDLADSFIFIKDGKVVLSCNLEELKNNEKLLIKVGSKLPFSIELSNKLISYELLKEIEPDIKKMVDLIWK